MVEISGQNQPMCCAGCQAVAQAIVTAGQSSFYKNRTEFSSKANDLIPDFLNELKVYDNVRIQQSFVRKKSTHIREASLLLEGITCAACIWLNEQHLARQKGVLSVQINYATHRARVLWDNKQIALSDILASIQSIGFVAHPYNPEQQQALLEKEAKVQLRRLGVAGIMGMQIMVISVALYLGAWSGIDASYRKLFHWAGFILVLPILLYSARPFFSAALRDIKSVKLGMDVPVSLGISIAFLGSFSTTLTGSGEVYYDSVAMFVFFLLTARFFEFKARVYSADVSERLTRATPTTTRRFSSIKKHYESIAVVDLEMGDRVKVYAGEVIPSDGFVIEGVSGVNESLLTGESLPRLCKAGDRVVAGSVNAESPLVVRVTAVGQDTVLSNLISLMEKAQGEKPAIAIFANRIAGWFVLFILGIATIAGVYWYQTGTDQWLVIVISLLVVTCPCALSLATPVALTAATGALANTGMIISGGSVLENMSKLHDFIFDKTGTLTDGQLKLIRMVNFSDYSDDNIFRLAAVLEEDSEHLIGKALFNYARELNLDLSTIAVQSIKNVPGQGVLANVDGSTYAIGNHEFVSKHSGSSLPESALHELSNEGASLVFLSQQSNILAAYLLGDEIRPGAKRLLTDLKKLGVETHLFTGDTKQAAYRVGDALGIVDVQSKMTPENKLSHMKAIQSKNKIVAMIGDGINDALVLAGANVSVAMGSAAGLAKLNADVVLTSNSLDVLGNGLRHAKRTVRIIHQNLGWALIYNLIAIPAAASGYVAPWMAALGMSLSSLFVVLNSSRLRTIPISKETS